MATQVLMIGKRVHKWRNRRSLSIEALAKKAGVNKNTIVRLEAGEKNTSLNTLSKVCSALEVSLDQLIDGSPIEGFDYAIQKGLPNGSLSFVILEISGETEMESHQGEELLFCLSGKIELDLNGKKISLNEGDSTLFWGSEPHSCSSKNAKALRVLAK